MHFKITWDTQDRFRITSIETKHGLTTYDELPWLVRKAIDVATEAHCGQLRKDGKTPYIVHPWRVLKICIDSEWNFSDEELAAFVMHDVIEDTHWPVQDVLKGIDSKLLILDETHLRTIQFQAILDIFQAETASIVWIMTKPIGHECRRIIYRVSLRRAAPSVLGGKLADALDNLMDLPVGVVKEIKECPECGGVGKIYEEDGDGHPRYSHDCDRCGGTGKIKVMFDEYFKDKVREDIMPLIPILRMHGTVWQNVANWFDTRMTRLLVP